jgi:hypothetical protein
VSFGKLDHRWVLFLDFHSGCVGLRQFAIGFSICKILKEEEEEEERLDYDFIACITHNAWYLMILNHLETNHEISKYIATILM